MGLDPRYSGNVFSLADAPLPQHLPKPDPREHANEDTATMTHDFTSVLARMEEQLKAHPWWKKRCDGTPLDNDTPVQAAVVALDMLREARTNALRLATEECERHIEFLRKEAHAGGDFHHLMARADEAAYLAKKIRALAPPDARASGASPQESKDFPP